MRHLTGEDPPLGRAAEVDAEDLSAFHSAAFDVVTCVNGLMFLPAHERCCPLPLPPPSLAPQLPLHTADVLGVRRKPGAVAVLLKAGAALPCRALCEWRRVLKPGGMAVVTGAQLHAHSFWPESLFPSVPLCCKMGGAGAGLPQPRHCSSLGRDVACASAAGDGLE